ncbi:MAG: hypothetical protein ABIM64_04715 [candidate division WOR-3 bacterium]
MNRENIISYSKSLVKIISDSKDVEFILDLPLIYNSINFIVGDSGAGKTILNQCIINSLLRKKEDCIIVWLDYEFQSSVAKQRRIDILLEKYPSLIYIDAENYIIDHNSRIDDKIENIKNTIDKNEKRKKNEEINMLVKEKIENPADFVLRISSLFCNSNSDKDKIIFVIDSFEDVVENTSDDVRIKNFLRSLLNFCSHNATYIISHHIGKKQDITDSMRFRGSMVIKNKCASMLLIHSKEKETDTDNDYIYSIEILKLRAYASFSRKFFLTVSLGNDNDNDYVIKKVEKNYDVNTRQVIREAFFLLRSHKHMKKTDLVLSIHKETKVARERVRNIIDSNSDLFNVSVDRHNTQIYSIDINKIEQICLMSGIVVEEHLTIPKQQLIKTLDSVDDDMDLNIEIKNSSGVITVYKKKAAILNAIFSISDEDVVALIQNIKNAVSPF